MGIEVMIYVYGAVCSGMIVFNVIYNLLLKRSEPKLERRCRKITAMIDMQIQRIREGLSVEKEHAEMMARKLRRVKNLIAFERVIRRLQDSEDSSVSEYLDQIYSIVLYLAVIYREREISQAAYFSYVISEYVTKRPRPMDSAQEILLDYVRKDNLYCRVNAIRALCALGNEENVVKALEIQDHSAVFLHEKILTESLLSFAGDQERLTACLWERMEDFSVHIQLAVLNYIRFRSGGYFREMMEVMEDCDRDKELRLSAIRYFGRYYYEPALEPLLAFVEDKEPSMWEYAAVSASSLSRYREPRVVETLKEALHHGNWYVRYNAAASLDALGITYSDLIEIVSGNDRYAREMIMYRLEARNRKEKGGAPAV